MTTKQSDWQPPKTKAEAAIRMAEGEVFAIRHKGTGRVSKVYSDESVNGTPFRVEYEGGVTCRMTDEWDYVTEFAQCKPEPKWGDNLSEQNPVWCWVWDKGGKAGQIVMPVVDRHDGVYIARYAPFHWDNAEPCPELAGANSNE